MESSVSTSDVNGYLGYQPSPSSVDQTDETTSSSTRGFEYFRTDSTSSAFSEHTDDTSCVEMASPFSWQTVKSPMKKELSRLAMRKHHEELDEETEMELMKERFSKLLLGEDMSGSGKGVCTAVTISNAITNLYASIFGQHHRLEPLSPEKKTLWRREMNCLLSICDYIVEYTPTVQHLKDGTTLEVMMTRPRSDIHLNLPALKKLDAMLQNLFDSFGKTEFSYAENGRLSGSSACSGSFRKMVQQHTSRKEEKWWLPVPCISPDGLSENSIKALCQRRDCANQIHKAAMAINNNILAEMEVPESFTASIPKSGKTILGDTIYYGMYYPETFSPNHLLDSLNISSDHEALELADKVEASMYTWRRKACMTHSKSSWEMVKELMSDNDKSDKNQFLAERAETLLFCLKQRYPELCQTSLDTSKIQYNKDVGQAILESYSRVLEGLAFNIVSWIEDLLNLDENMKKQD